MPGMRVVVNTQHHGIDKIRAVAGKNLSGGLVGCAATGIAQILTGNPVVLTTNTTFAQVASGTIMASLRNLTSGDYAAASSVFGIAQYPILTDANGASTLNPVGPVGLTGSQVQFPIPTMGSILEAEITQGRTMVTVSSISDLHLVEGSLWENTTVNEGLVGTQVGYIASTLLQNGVYIPYFFWSTAAAVKVGTIFSTPKNDLNYNLAVTANVANTTHYPRCPIYVRVNATYDQAKTGVSYTT